MVSMKFVQRDSSITDKTGEPAYINCSPISLPDQFSTEVIGKKTLTKSKQKESTSIMAEDSPGWLAFVSGQPDMIKLFGWAIADYRRTHLGDRFIWERINGTRYSKVLDPKITDKWLSPRLIVVDSLLTHSVNGSKDVTYDPVRVGKVHDICSAYSGLTSILVLCPDIPLEVAESLIRFRPQISISLKQVTSSEEY